VNVCATPPRLAVRIKVCAAVTDVAVAVKLALLDPCGISTAAGTVTAAALLARFTVNPPPGAALLSVTVQASVPDPVNEPVAQVNELSVGKMEIEPVPLKPMASVPPPAALLARVRIPVTAPVAVGVNCTITPID
jgi:hypothetical protein